MNANVTYAAKPQDRPYTSSRSSRRRRLLRSLKRLIRHPRPAFAERRLPGRS
ncbi:Protein of unknown function [Thermobacillus xylanilyticus]|uniref:Uncharacterized protein n=1 Tax=Thermobacillus xylanilyticus TaxID=76633 RepID=A0ABN7SCA5_THEXY|nr:MULTISPECIES: hypothetical protein [Thermobacillus]CAG5092724.1 Protein of unknown function [Thermobacillus xylanilyticus]